MKIAALAGIGLAAALTLTGCTGAMEGLEATTQTEVDGDRIYRNILGPELGIDSQGPQMDEAVNLAKTFCATIKPGTYAETFDAWIEKAEAQDPEHGMRTAATILGAAIPSYCPEHNNEARVYPNTPATIPDLP